MGSLKDATASLAGGGAGMALLLTVDWSKVPSGECVKIGTAFALMMMGYFMYNKNGKDSQP